MMELQSNQEAKDKIAAVSTLNGLSSPIKRNKVARQIKKQDQLYVSRDPSQL